MIIFFDHKNMIMPTHTPSISYKQLLTYRHIMPYPRRPSHGSFHLPDTPQRPLNQRTFRTKFWNTLWWTNIAMENGHRNSGFSHEKWWFPIVMLVYQRVELKFMRHDDQFWNNLRILKDICPMAIAIRMGLKLSFTFYIRKEWFQKHTGIVRIIHFLHLLCSILTSFK